MVIKRWVIITACCTAFLHGCATTGPELNTPAPIVDINSSNAALTASPNAPASHFNTAPEDAVGAPNVPVEINEAAPTPAIITPRPIISNALHPTALALLNESIRQENSGELEIAAAKLERALRIEPRNPLLWHYLAALRLRQGQATLAVNLAQKSNAYAKQDTDLLARNQRIIDQARAR